VDLCEVSVRNDSVSSTGAAASASRLEWSGTRLQTGSWCQIVVQHLEVMQKVKEFARLSLSSRRLLLANMLTSSTLQALGDTIQQRLEARHAHPSSQDWWRTGSSNSTETTEELRVTSSRDKVITIIYKLDCFLWLNQYTPKSLLSARLAMVGLVLGAVSHNWYKFLDKRFHRGKCFKTLVRKILLDQLIASPVMAFTFVGGACVFTVSLNYWC